ncbi:MAG: FecR family protein [Myxococcota bacterium]|nr:FecR family protein [Myxococcota bacterium]
MNRIVLTMTTVCILCLTTLLAVPVMASKDAGVVIFLTGKAEVSIDKKSWSKLVVNNVIFYGTHLRTKKGTRMEIKLGNGSRIRLAPNSQIFLSDPQGRIKGRKPGMSIQLTVGKIWSKVRALMGAQDNFEVKTTHAVAGVRGTSFNVAVDNKGTSVNVFEGKVLVSNKPIYQIKGHTKANRVPVSGPQMISKREWNETIANAMESIRVGKDGKMSKAMPIPRGKKKRSPWEAWNMKRDKATEAEF